MARDSRILSPFDPETGIEEIFHYDDTNDTFAIERRQLVDLDLFTKPLYNNHSDVGASRWKGDFHHVASIPMSIYMEWVRTGKVKDEKFIRRWLDDPDNQVFRTMPGKLSR